MLRPPGGFQGSVAGRVVVVRNGRGRECGVVYGYFVRAASRILVQDSVVHDVPRHRRRGAPGSGRAVNELSVYVEGGATAILGRDEVVPAVTYRGGRPAGVERGPAKPVVEEAGAVVSEYPAA